MLHSLCALDHRARKGRGLRPIQAEPGLFSSETTELFEALGNRIEREDNDHYTLMGLEES